MSRFAPFILLAGLLALVGLFLTLFRYETTTYQKGRTGEALLNPFFASQLFLENREIPTKTVKRLDSNEPLPEGNSVIYLLGNRRNYPPQYNQKLLDWAAAGGVLVIKPDPDWPETENDELLDEPGFYLAAEEDDEQGSISVNWESGYQTTFSFENTVLFGSHNSEALYLQIGENEKYRLAIMPHGDGAVCVIADDTFMRNDWITQKDNAWLTWTLATGFHDSPREIWLVTGTQYSSIWRHVYQRGGPLLLTLILLVVCFCWSRGYREEAVQPDPPPVRRRLLEHIEHAGLFLWRNGRSTVLARAVVRELLNTLRRRHLLLQDADPAEVHRFMASQSGLPVETVKAAVNGPETHTEREFLDRIVDLETIRRTL
ncbi:DUF4350 domain-containing protein [Acanthopleuribacter pedis]|uniref:DUF4350 domain-containing protein n=1 Tax=Acanthopleuribacter pedis TaxID=442870 RepID=A0A8J7Q9L7_9BACT|nr:DUF4350 domain-containing protein [Acanthopleuribacter pedis]MBO1320247.1 DUF4350 domain-containing protein [Acanthopleuribacter pedis]